MQEHARMVAAWKQSSAPCVLVTVTATRGSSYRSPGARMLILPDGSRIGAVSGGCLEGELSRRAHWWTSQSPVVSKTFDTTPQEDSEGFGLGCGGSIDLLLERLPTFVDATPAHPLLAQEQVNHSRAASALAVITHATERSGLRTGSRFLLDTVQDRPEIAALLRRCAAVGYSFAEELRDGSAAGCRVFVEALQPPVQLLVCGAGSDAQPLAAMAATLGWQVIVLDRRADLARPARFPDADRVLTATDAALFATLSLDARTAAIVMTHSFAQDSFFLSELLTYPLGYLGVLGARHRTQDLFAALGHDVIPPAVHAPAGLDIGAETPQQIALSILGEMQAVFAKRNGGTLRARKGSIHGRELEGHEAPHAVSTWNCGT